jgi:hypothetical protein
LNARYVIIKKIKILQKLVQIVAINFREKSDLPDHPGLWVDCWSVTVIKFIMTACTRIGIIQADKHINCSGENLFSYKIKPPSCAKLSPAGGRGAL